MVGRGTGGIDMETVDRFTEIQGNGPSILVHHQPTKQYIITII